MKTDDIQEDMKVDEYKETWSFGSTVILHLLVASYIVQYLESNDRADLIISIVVILIYILLLYRI